MVVLVALAALLCGVPTPAWAQRVEFERTFQVAAPATVDVSTVRGTITVTTARDATVTVRGVATVRFIRSSVEDGERLARQLAANPPVVREGSTIRLRPPAEAVQARALTVSYEVTVPPGTHVVASSDSGAIRVEDVTGPVTVTTQSGAIALRRLGAETTVTSGSGAVDVAGVGGALVVSTASSAIDLRDVRAGVDARTNSGAVAASMAGRGDVRVRTSSSEVRLDGIDGGLSVSTESGRVRASGLPRSVWEVSTGSGSVELGLAAGAGLTLDAATRSGSVDATTLGVSGSSEKRRVSGTIGGGGSAVRINTRSGSIRLRQGTLEN